MVDFYEVLIAELRDDPLGVGYANMTDAQVAEVMNDPTRAETEDHTFYTMRALIERFVANGIDPASVINRLDAVAAQNPIVAEGLRALRAYGDGGGLDFASPATVAMIQQLQQAGVLSEAEANAVLSLGKRKCSRSESLGLGYIDPDHITCARRLMGG